MRNEAQDSNQNRQPAPVALFSIFLRITCVLFFIITHLTSQQIEFLERQQNLLSAGTVDYLSKNLGTAPINNILLIDAGSEAPDNFEIMYIYTWPGTKRGCFAGSGQYIGEISDNKGLTEDTTIDYEAMVTVSSGKCENLINKQDPETIFNWGMQKFILQRNKEFYYKRESEACKDEYIACSGTLCVSKDEECPITGVKIHNQDSVHKEIEIIRDYDKDLLYNIEVSLLDRPCYTIGNIPEKKSPYKLLNVQNGCSTYGPDNYVEVLDVKSQVDFFSENDLSHLFQDLPGYQESIRRDSALLVARKRIEIDKSEQCQRNIPLESFVTNLQSLQNHEGLLIIIRIIEMLIFGLTFFLKYEEVFRLLEVYCFIELFLTTFSISTCLTTVKLQTIQSFSFLIENNCLNDDALISAIADFKGSVASATLLLYILPLLALMGTSIRVIVYRYAKYSSYFLSSNQGQHIISDFESPQHDYIMPLLDTIYPPVIRTPLTNTRNHQNIAVVERSTSVTDIEMSVLNSSEAINNRGKERSNECNRVTRE